NTGKGDRGDMRLVCMPNPTPSRNEVAAMFVEGAKANPQYMKEAPVDSEFRFMSAKWPCKKGHKKTKGGSHEVYQWDVRNHRFGCHIGGMRGHVPDPTKDHTGCRRRCRRGRHNRRDLGECRDGRSHWGRTGRNRRLSPG